MLANNRKRLKLKHQRIHGTYDDVTRKNVCKLQAYLVKKGYNLGSFGNNGVDGKWGELTHKAFKKAEDAGEVNWRYAHVKIGIFTELSVHVPSPVEWLYGDKSGGCSIGGGLFGLDDLSGNLSSRSATFMTERQAGQGLAANFKGIVAIAYGARGTVHISSQGFDWDVSAGPARAGYIKKAQKLKKAIELLAKLKSIESKVDMLFKAYRVAETLSGDGIWKGDKGLIAIPVWGVGIGAYGGDTETTILSKEE